MLNEPEFDELNNFQEHFTQATLHYNGTVFTWKDLCKPFCDINAMLTKAMPYIGFATKGYPNFNIDIPFFFSAKMNLGKNLFQREMDEQTGELKAVKLMAFYYTTFLDSEEKSKKVEVFENNIVELARIHNANDSNRVEIIPHGTYMVKKEIVDGSKT
uniref:Uncharacterized protein n=1 Tax=Acrobeloides nanus TaxID=290746 RepID=A0A914D1F8_9BILA